MKEMYSIFYFYPSKTELKPFDVIERIAPPPFVEGSVKNEFSTMKEAKRIVEFFLINGYRDHNFTILKIYKI